jgi:hypothetical protein
MATHPHVSQGSGLGLPAFGARSTPVGGQTGGVEGEAVFDAKFKLAASSLIRAAMVEDLDTAELIISQHDLCELTRATALISAQGWTMTNGYNMARRWSP